MVGSQVYDYFKNKYSVLGVSKSPNGKLNGSWNELNRKCEIIFVCVPTPFDFKKRESNFKIVKEVLRSIAQRKIVVIKSTIWPGLTEKFQKKFPKLKILFNPEFLSRKTAKRDFEMPDRQIVGYTTKSKGVAKKIMNILPKGKLNQITKSGEAELIKYSHNVYGALRVIYANHLFEVSQKLGIDYEIVKKGFAASEFIGPGVLRYMTIFHNNKRGYAGPCFPKDVNSYIEFCDKMGIAGELVKSVRSANQRILSEQGLTEEKVEKL